MEIECNNVAEYLATLKEQAEQLLTDGELRISLQDDPYGLKLGVLIANSKESKWIFLSVKNARNFEGLSEEQSSVFRRTMLTTNGKEAFIDALLKIVTNKEPV